MTSASFHDIKKYMIKVGKNQKRNITTEEAVEQINSHGDVDTAIQNQID